MQGCGNQRGNEAKVSGLQHGIDLLLSLDLEASCAPQWTDDGKHSGGR
jgi:hypothetical protein